ncbi:hypothetical protein E2320_010438 [Naja naja]|nr:hypothetical protein E2320_010438 [Naja naja]
MSLCQGCTLTANCGKVAGSASQETVGGGLPSPITFLVPDTKVPQLPNIGLSVSAQHFLLTNICSLSRLSKYSKAMSAFLQPQQSSWFVL